MAINPQEITTDLTLELDEEAVSIADFQKAIDNFLGLVKEVSKSVSGAPIGKSDWLVKVYSGSAGIGVFPGSANLYADAVGRAVICGMPLLANGVRPKDFTDSAIQHSKNLASLFKGAKIEPNVKIILKNREFVRMDRKIAISAKDMLTGVYEEDGAVDGILETVEGHGALKFIIYDLIDDRAIQCAINHELLPQALRNFKKRVEVIGIVRYRKDGVPVGVKASRIIDYPDKSEIPSIDSMRALLSVGGPV